MDGINPLISGQYPPSALVRDEKKKTETAKAGKSAFQRALEKSSGDNPDTASISAEVLSSPDQLEDWVDQIFQLGEDLKKDATLQSLARYREKVGSFLKFVSSEGYRVERNKGILNPRTFKQKEFVNVEVVNKKLESLAAYILSSQKDQLEILRRVDEIQGLIVDYIG